MSRRMEIERLDVEIAMVESEMSAHRLRHEDTPAWRARANALAAQRSVLEAERTHELALLASEGVSC